MSAATRSVTLSVLSWAAWAPGLETPEAVAAWARGETSIRRAPDAPALEFLPALFRRRLSQLSRMVLEVGHRLGAGSGPRPCVFSSRYGEIARQYAITADLLDAGEVSPALFSLSVFNTPAFLLSIAEKNTAPASAVYSGDWGLPAAFLDLFGLLDSGLGLLIFADEAVPLAWAPLFPEISEPYAFGLSLSREPQADARALHLAMTPAFDSRPPIHPLEFLRWLAMGMKDRFAFSAPGTDFIIEAAP
jgi:hypothetical protein